MKNKYLILLNKKINVNLIIKKKYIYIYIWNKKKYFLIKYFKNIEKKIFFNKNFKYMIFKKLKKEIIFFLNNILNNLFFFYINKINYIGKNFKLKKLKNNKNIFLFNNSHIKLFKEYKIKIIKNNKTSFLIIFNNIFYINKFLNFIKKLFKINIFTKKGIKLSRNILYYKKIRKK